MRDAIRHRDVVADGIRLHVAEAGRGPALLLLHGLSASHAVWEHVMPAFADRWRVIAPDLPGHGASAKPDAPYTIDFFAGVLRSLARVLDVEAAVVVGSSLGGHVALELAVGYPRFTQALALAAPAYGYPPAYRVAGLALQALTPQLLRATLPEALRQSFYDRARLLHATRGRILTERLVADDFPQFARAVARALTGVLTAPSLALEQVRQPVAIVWGRQDRLVPMARSTPLLTRIPHATLHVLERCGHLPMLEQPAAFVRLLDVYLGTLAAHAGPEHGAP
ncbi:MAG: alpha/beta fold hydrolase [bacterium]|nr:alpha/beta fold hydrolase [bacterium]